MQPSTRYLRLRWWTAGTIALVLVTFGGLVGALVTGAVTPWQIPFPYTQLHAAAAATADSFAVATGPIGEEIEGVFFLDGLSGELQCTVFNPRSATFNALFKRNVALDLGLEQGKRPRFLMVTGIVNLGRNIVNAGQSANCVVYVVEATSGKFAAYAVPWRSDLFLRGQPQGGELLLLGAGGVRSVAVRD